jgi:hypothetical protein
MIYVVTKAGDVVGVYDSEREARRVADIAKAVIWLCHVNWGCVAVDTNQGRRGWH